MIYIPKQKLTKLVTKMRHYDVHPIYLPDVEYQHGEKHPLIPLIEDTVSELHEYLLIANDDELKAMYEALDSYYQMQINVNLLLNRDEQTLKNMAMYLVVTLTHQSYYDVKRYIRADYREQSEVLKTYPELANYEDYEGLIPYGIPGFVPAGVGGGMYYKDHLIFYHQFLRRYFTSGLNSPFLNELVTYHKNHRKQRVAVAIDHLRLMPKELFSQTFEKARSFGPPLAIEDLDDPHKVGLAEYVQSDPTLISLHRYERTEFHWSYSDGIKTFQVEEVYSLEHLPDISEDIVLARYIHSLRDIEAHAFIHLDGAVKIYRRNQYAQRYAQRMPDRLKALEKIKLFRIDADIKKGQSINDNEWSRLIGFFFQENSMIAQYLNPDFLIEG